MLMPGSYKDQQGNIKGILNREQRKASTAPKKKINPSLQRLLSQFQDAPSQQEDAESNLMEGTGPGQPLPESLPTSGGEKKSGGFLGGTAKTGMKKPGAKTLAGATPEARQQGSAQGQLNRERRKAQNEATTERQEKQGEKNPKKLSDEKKEEKANEKFQKGSRQALKQAWINSWYQIWPFFLEITPHFLGRYVMGSKKWCRFGSFRKGKLWELIEITLFFTIYMAIFAGIILSITIIVIIVLAMMKFWKLVWNFASFDNIYAILKALF